MRRSCGGSASMALCIRADSCRVATTSDAAETARKPRAGAQESAGTWQGVL